MELRIEPASDDLYLRLREWRYPPPYDFYDGDVDPPSNPERFFVALDPEGELVGFYYFEEKPPDLDYGLGLRPDLVGRGARARVLQRRPRVRARALPAAARLPARRRVQRARAPRLRAGRLRGRLPARAQLRALRRGAVPDDGGVDPGSPAPARRCAGERLAGLEPPTISPSGSLLDAAALRQLPWSSRPGRRSRAVDAGALVEPSTRWSYPHSAAGRRIALIPARHARAAGPCRGRLPVLRVEASPVQSKRSRAARRRHRARRARRVAGVDRAAGRVGRVTRSPPRAAALRPPGARWPSRSA